MYIFLGLYICTGQFYNVVQRCARTRACSIQRLRSIDQPLDKHEISSMIDRSMICLFLRSLPMESQGSPVPPGGERGHCRTFQRRELWGSIQGSNLRPPMGTRHFNPLCLQVVNTFTGLWVVESTTKERITRPLGEPSPVF